MVSNSIFLAFCVGILAIIARTYRLVLFRFKVNEVKLPAETVLKNSETAAETIFNKNMDERYPLMANAIYSEDEMQLILMIWGIPWERMTLGQANMLTVIGYLIQNAVVRANRYIAALEQQRYIQGTNILEPEAFSSLVKAYLKARDKGLTQ